MLTAVYCGVPGSYAEEAAILYFGDEAQLITASSFQNAFDRLRDGQIGRWCPSRTAPPEPLRRCMIFWGGTAFTSWGNSMSGCGTAFLPKRRRSFPTSGRWSPTSRGSPSRWNFWGNIRSGCGEDGR